LGILGRLLPYQPLPGYTYDKDKQKERET